MKRLNQVWNIGMVESMAISTVSTYASVLMHMLYLERCFLFMVRPLWFVKLKIKNIF